MFGTKLMLILVRQHDSRSGLCVCVSMISLLVQSLSAAETSQPGKNEPARNKSLPGVAERLLLKLVQHR